MVENNLIWFASDMENGGQHCCIIPKMANRHGLIAGATGTGKSVTLKVLAESFSDMGVPVFLADVKGDLAGMMKSGVDSANMQERIARFGLSAAGFSYRPYPVTFWDLFGKNGIQLRTTISEMGPLLLARLMGLNDLQSDILTIAFKIADDNNLLLVDTKDLKALLNFVSENAKDFSKDYGNLSPTSIATIIRAVVALELAGGETFFGETALNISDWFTTDPNGRGMIHILDSQSLISNTKLYSTFLLWLLSEMFETLPEVGDLEKPKMVFFFDEAHLLFKDAPKALVEKIEQVVKLIRSKGIGIYFVTQTPRDVPDSVLSQLGNKIVHGLRAYTPTDQKSVKAAADSFRVNPAFNTYETLQSLGTGEAVISVLDEKGIPTVAQKVNILPPQSFMGSIDAESRESAIKSSALNEKYSVAFDPDSAYEFLSRRGMEAESPEGTQAPEVQPSVAAQPSVSLSPAVEEVNEAPAPSSRPMTKTEEFLMRKNAEKNAASASNAPKPAQQSARQPAKQSSSKSAGRSAVSSIGKELGKSVGSSLGSVGKKVGGNLGSSLARGLFSTLFSGK